MFSESADFSLPSLVSATLFFLFAANTLDMGGTIGLKYASYLPAAILAGTGLGKVRLELPVSNFLMFLFLAYPSLALCTGLAAGADPMLAVSQVTPFLPPAILFLLLRRLDPGNPIPYRIFCWSTLPLAVAVIVLFPLFLWIPDRAPVANLLETLSSPGFGYFGTRKAGDLDLPNTYFRATLFLVPAFAYFHLTGRRFAARVSFIGLVLSLSRAGTLLCIGLYVIEALRSRKVLPILVLAAGAAALYCFLPDATREALSGITMEGETTRVRLRHLDSLQTLFDRNPPALLFGQGAGVEFFSTGAGADVSNIEIDHFNAIRKFGLAWFLPFLFLFLRTTANLIGGGSPEKRAIGISLVLLFLAAGTNPVFVNPLFFLAFVAALHASGPADEPNR